MKTPAKRSTLKSHRTAAQVESAFAACRSIRFAVKNASRFNGEFSLNDILAADVLAREALGNSGGVS